jgi:hypothetical protein
MPPFGPGDLHPETRKPLTDWWDWYTYREALPWAS